MPLRRIGQRLIFLMILMVAGGLVAVSPLGQNWLGYGVDYLFWARHHWQGPIASPAASKVALIVVDEDSYQQAPFKDTPRVAWTPYFADIVDAAAESGALAVGFDYVFPTSLDRSDLLRGYDKPLLKTLRKLARQDQIVLGEVRLSENAIAPYAGQIKMVGQHNIAPLNVTLDSDGVVRRARPALPLVSGGDKPGFVAALLAKAGLPVPDRDWWINYNTGLSDLPIYGLADLHHCLQQDHKTFFEQAFADRIVLVGTWLDVEDRRLTSKRLAMPLSSWSSTASCSGATQTMPQIARQSMPGIGIHAAAINTIASGNGLKPLTIPMQSLMVVMVIGFAGLAFLFLPLSLGLFSGLGLVAVSGMGSVLAFGGGTILPVIPMILAVPVAWGGSFAFRYLIEDRDKRRIESAFGQYLAPSLVEEMSRSGRTPALGGETRRVTIWFSDIAGYTDFSEALADTPDKLVAILNAYFTVLGGVIGKHGGYIDKFIGDAAMVIWGAPVEQQDQERRAVMAAMEAMAALDRFNKDVIVGQYKLPPISTRIGLNTGRVLVGNMGSEQRLNYTVIGDAVNLAARLESANKNFGTRLMIGESTARPLHRDFVLRRLDKLVVKGKTRPVKVYQVIGLRDQVPETMRDHIRIFHQGMAHYYRREFLLARQRFDFIKDADPVAAIFVDRCRHFEESPPPPDWDGRFVMTSK